MVEQFHEEGSAETTEFVDSLIKLIQCYEGAVDKLEAENNNTQKELQGLVMELEMTKESTQCSEQSAIAAISTFVTAAFKDEIADGDASVALTAVSAMDSVSEADPRTISTLKAEVTDERLDSMFSLPGFKELKSSIDTYKAQTQASCKALEKKLDRAVSRADDAEANVTAVSSSLRTLGKEIVAMIAQISSQDSDLSSSIINESSLDNESAGIQTLVHDFSSFIKALSECTTQASSRLMQVETELQFYKGQAATRADSEQRTLEEFSKQAIELEKLQQEYAKSLTLTSDLQTGLYAKNSEIAELREELRTVAQSLNVEKEKTENLNKELITAKQEYSNLQASLVTEQSRVSAMVNIPLQLEQTQAALQTAEEKCAKLEKENHEMGQTMTAQTDMIKQLNGKLGNVNEDKDKLSNELREAEAANHRLQLELQTCMRDLSAGNVQSQVAIQNIQEELDYIKQRNERLSMQIQEQDSLKEEIARLQEAERILTMNLKDCEAELVRTQEINIALQTDIVDISQEKEQIKEQSSSEERLINSKLDGLQQTISEKEAEIAVLQKRVEDLTSDVKVREEMIANCEEEVGRLDALNTSTVNKLQTTLQQKIALEAELFEKRQLLNDANANLTVVTSDMQSALKVAEDAFTDKYLKVTAELKTAQAEVAELEEKLTQAIEETRLLQTKLTETEAALTEVQAEKEVILQERNTIVDTLQSSLVRRDEASGAMEAQNNGLREEIETLKAHISYLEEELGATTQLVIAKENELQILMANGCAIQNMKMAEQAEMLTQQTEHIASLRADLSGIEKRLHELAGTTTNILEVLDEVTLNSNRSVIDSANPGSQAPSRATSVAGSLALSNMTRTVFTNIGKHRADMPRGLNQRDSEAALAIERTARLEEAVMLIQDGISHVSMLTKQRLEEVAMLQERIEVKEKEVNLLLDLTKSREDRITVLLEEISTKNATINEQTQIITTMTKNFQKL